MKEISIGVLTFVGEVAGAHVHVAVLGDGLPGQRPLCGRITVSLAEWLQLEHTATAMLIAARPVAATGGELGRMDLALAKARAERDLARAQLELLQSSINASRKFFGEQAASTNPTRRELATIVVNTLNRIMGDDGGN